MKHSADSCTHSVQRQIDDISGALGTHPRWAGLVFQRERWDVAVAIWGLTALPVAEHALALAEMRAELAPHDPTTLDALCAAYRRAMLRWGGAKELSEEPPPPPVDRVPRSGRSGQRSS